MSDAQHIIYCFNNGGSPGWMNAVAIADDGHVLAQHICSNEGFMLHDLGITSNWKHENYNAHFGEGNWRVEWVQNPAAHEGLQQAFKLNAALPTESTAVPEPAARELVGELDSRDG